MARKEKKYHFIYKTTNLLSGKYYIGMHSTDNLEDGYMGSGKRLRYSLNKYGKENHKREILEFFDTREELAKEAEIVNLNAIAKKDCLNLKVGGEGGSDCLHINLNGLNNKVNQCSLGGKANAEKLKTDINYQIKHKVWTSKNGKKMFEMGYFKPLDWTNRTHSESTKELISEKAKLRVGNKNSQYGTCWITNGIENKKVKKDTEIPIGWYKGRQ